jgi:hypothetical protein
MNRHHFTFAAVLATALAGASSMVWAADPSSETTRQERMDAAYDNYRSNSGSTANPNPGRFERAENSVKRGAHKAGTAIKHGAQKTGHAIGKGVRKTGEAIGNTGEKLEDKSAPKP